LSYFHHGDLAQAIIHFNDSIRAFKERGYEHLNRILDPLVMLSKAYFKKNEQDLGTYALHSGIELSEKLKDHVLLRIFTFLKSLYVDNNFEQLEQISEWLEMKSMYPDLEDLAKDAAKYYNELGDKDKAMLFYEKILYFQVQVKRGDCLYEI
jgi:response regulator aspartate phosphatase A (stage 0 sporulation protein L)